MLMQLLALGSLAAVSLFLFFPLNTDKGLVLQSRVVHRIPFVPAFVLPYLGLFPYVAFSMLAVLFFTPVAARLYVSLIFAGIVAALIWYFMPTITSGRPELVPSGPFTRIVAWMYRLDPGGNSLPSAHASTALICSYYLTYVFPVHEVAIWACGATIVGSTLFVKQHHMKDLAAGALLALTSIGFSYWILGSLT